MVRKKTTKKTIVRNKKTVSRKRKTKFDWRKGLVGPATRRSNPLSTLEDVEIAHIQSVLKAYGNDIQQAARALGVARSTIYRKMKSF